MLPTAPLRDSQAAAEFLSRIAGVPFTAERLCRAVRNDRIPATVLRGRYWFRESALREYLATPRRIRSRRRRHPLSKETSHA